MSQVLEELRYNESHEPITAAEIDAAVSLAGASLDRAITIATMLVYNCDGFMNDRLRAEVGNICGELARKAMELATEQQERIARLNATVTEQSKEIAALKAKPARKPRVVKGA